MIPQLIYCADGNKKFSDIAIKNGFLYGARLPSKFHNPIYFADQDWKNPDKESYIKAMQEHKPRIATVIDWDNNTDYGTVMDWAVGISDIVDTIIIIPKIHNTIHLIPETINGKSVRLGYSVPTSYGGTELLLSEFGRRPVHLLGGSPHKQMELCNYLNVHSIDGNYHQKMASERRQVFSNIRLIKSAQKSFPKCKDFSELDFYDIYTAFDISCKNVKIGWYGIKNLFIRFGEVTDIPAIINIYKQHKSKLGFLRNVTVAEHISKKECLVAVNSENIPIGFVLFHTRLDGITTIYDIASKYPNQDIGKALILSVPKPIRLKCMDNNEAIYFYEKMGFEKIGEKEGKNKNLNVYYKDKD